MKIAFGHRKIRSPFRNLPKAFRSVCASSVIIYLSALYAIFRISVIETCFKTRMRVPYISRNIYIFAANFMGFCPKTTYFINNYFQIS